MLCKTTNGVTTKYVYGNGLIGEAVGSTFKTYHFDCRGSTIAITDAAGNVTDTFAYDTYGKLLSRTGTSKVIFGYKGRDGVITDDNGLIYMRARYYSPDMRRFVNADIISGQISNSVTLNRYAYANGNPVSFVDPFGLWSLKSAWNKAINWVKEKVVVSAAKITKKVVTAVTSFFKPETHKVEGDFRDGALFGSGSISGGNFKAGISGETAASINNDESSEGKLNAEVDLSIANAEGTLGVGNEWFSVSLNGDVDVLTAGANAGIAFKDQLGIFAESSASVASAEGTVVIDVLGFGIELGVNADALSVGAGIEAGMVKTNDGKTKIGFEAETGVGLFGWGPVFGVVLPF